MDGLMTLDDGLISAVMTHFSLPRAEPDEDFLQQIMWAYVTHVPWESASRLARKRVGISAEAAPPPAQ